MMSNAITTFTGKIVDIFNIKPEDICLADIAHALALTCRFSGHCSVFYSVAEHSVRASTMAMGQYDILPVYLLVHDAAEAYIGDIPRPIKRKVFDPQIETTVRIAILDYFKLDVGYWYKNIDVINEIDDILLNIEIQDLLSGGLDTTDIGQKPLVHNPVRPLKTWQEAERSFLEAAKYFGLKDV